ncbi:hypothetical protein V6N13_131254 [Hibiscus sabdariffa]
MATPRWRGGPHGSIPCKQIGVVELAQAIHAVSGPGHLEVARRALSTVDIDYGILSTSPTCSWLIICCRRYRIIMRLRSLKQYIRFWENTISPMDTMWREANGCLYVKPDEGIKEKEVGPLVDHVQPNNANVVLGVKVADMALDNGDW